MDIAAAPRTVALTRLGYAASALLTPRLATASIGLRTSDVTPATRVWTAFFATREAALGAVTLATEEAEPAVRRKALLLNAAVDGVDAVTALLLGLRYRRWRLVLLAVPAGVCSAMAHYQAAQELGVGEVALPG